MIMSRNVFFAVIVAESRTLILLRTMPVVMTKLRDMLISGDVRPGNFSVNLCRNKIVRQVAIKIAWCNITSCLIWKKIKVDTTSLYIIVVRQSRESLEFLTVGCVMIWKPHSTPPPSGAWTFPPPPLSHSKNVFSEATGLCKFESYWNMFSILDKLRLIA